MYFEIYHMFVCLFINVTIWLFPWQPPQIHQWRSGTEIRQVGIGKRWENSCQDLHRSTEPGAAIGKNETRQCPSLPLPLCNRHCQLPGVPCLWQRVKGQSIMGECFIQNFSQGYENIMCEGGLEISVPPPLSPHFVAPFSLFCNPLPPPPFLCIM